ncbi:MAG: HAD family hydrolase [Clostridia bacterium]|nr:HAD family hydrolase [Clostridia bacterium]
MSIKAILFDLDGTLLPMNQEMFLKAYMGGLAAHMAPHGYDPDTLIKSIWASTMAVIKADGTMTNEDMFWHTITSICGEQVKKDLPIFEEFYEEKFQQVSKTCGCNPLADKVIKILKEKGITLILATNPVFPAVATNSRIKWAGLDRNDFALVTTYENSHFCKPNINYYVEILNKMELNPSECIMVGNDVGEDMIAATLGLDVFLVTDYLINTKGLDTSNYPQGDLNDLLNYLADKI